MNEYTDLQVLECNRLHSEEAKSNNNENFASWTNNLQDIVHLEPGDKVSIHGAMINEKGAGQSQAIEIKGVNLGYRKDFEFVETTFGDVNTDIASGYDQILTNASTQSIDIRDDTLTFALTYYQTANGHNYMQLPRKWWYDKTENTSINQWTSTDRTSGGQTEYDYTIETDKFAFHSEYYTYDNGDTDVTTGRRYFKHKNDNQRYTLMIRDKTYYNASNASGNLPRYFEDEVTAGLPGRMRDPENAIYHTYKELKQIVVPSGFNSPEYLSDEITRQLQEITDETIHKKTYTDPSTPADRFETPVPLFRTISTESYKPFNVANTFRKINASFDTIEDAFDEYYNASVVGGSVVSGNASGFDWLSQYQIVATKRPELYETGRLVNEQFQEFATFDNTYTGIFGSKLKYAWLETEGFITLDIAYNKNSVEKWRDFFLAQEKYPEVWKFFKETTNDYNDGDTIDNSRWMHMNRYNNASMTWTDQAGEAMLGDSYYKKHDWVGSNVSTPIHSALLPLYYDPAQKDEFYEYNATRTLIGDNKLSYGCMTTNVLGYLMFKTTPNNGIGSALYTELKQDSGDTSIEAERKCGFDMHFTAPAMCYNLPYAGYSQNIASYQNSVNQGDYEMDAIGYWSATAEAYGNVMANKLYFGADAPRLNWDGTNFAFSDLHTSLNKGNDDRANNGQLTGFPAINDAGDVVYKINPKELLNDWTPARKPYILEEATAQHGGTKFPILNKNLEPWEIYDSSCGIFIQDFNLTEREWSGTLWELLGFTYAQFNSSVNTRLIKTDNQNVDSLYPITTNADIGQADSKIYVQNSWGVPLYNTMMPLGTNIAVSTDDGTYYPPIDQKTVSIQITGNELPTRMIRGYYTIRSNILSNAPFIGGKVNNTTMPIIGIVDKINGDGDFYFGQDSSLEFTTTKAMRLASIACSIHDPDGSYARCGDQSTVLFKIQKSRNVTYNVVQQILAENKGKF